MPGSDTGASAYRVLELDAWVGTNTVLPMPEGLECPAALLSEVDSVLLNSDATQTAGNTMCHRHFSAISKLLCGLRAHCPSSSGWSLNNRL